MIRLLSIILTILLPSSIIVFIFAIFASNRQESFDCHIEGCDASFNSMEKLVDHLIEAHDYKIRREDYYA